MMMRCLRPVVVCGVAVVLTMTTWLTTYGQWGPNEMCVTNPVGEECSDEGDHTCRRSEGGSCEYCNSSATLPDTFCTYMEGSTCARLEIMTDCSEAGAATWKGTCKFESSLGDWVCIPVVPDYDDCENDSRYVNGCDLPE